LTVANFFLASVDDDDADTSSDADANADTGGDDVDASFFDRRFFFRRFFSSQRDQNPGKGRDPKKLMRQNSSCSDIQDLVGEHFLFGGGVLQ
jgi:hypothetical protein